MNDRLKIIKSIEDNIKAFEKLEHDAGDHTYYKALYEMSKSMQSVINYTNNYHKNLK